MHIAKSRKAELTCMACSTWDIIHLWLTDLVDAMLTSHGNRVSQQAFVIEWSKEKKRKD